MTLGHVAEWFPREAAMQLLQTKEAAAGEGTAERCTVYSLRCASCSFQTLWHRDSDRAYAALVRHTEQNHPV